MMDPLLRQYRQYPFDDHLHYASQVNRRATFANWPKEEVLPADEMARCGFIFLGREDYVKCVFCGGYLHNWENKDKPLFWHKLYYPHCDHVKSLEGAMVAEADCNKMKKSLPIFVTSSQNTQ